MAENFRLDRPIGFARGGQVFLTPEFQRALTVIDRGLGATQDSTDGVATLAVYPPCSQRVVSASYSAPQPAPVFASYGGADCGPFLARYST